MGVKGRCIVNGEVSLPYGVFKEHSNQAVKVTLGEADKIKGLITLPGPRRRHAWHTVQRTPVEKCQGSRINQAGGEP